MGLVLEIDQPLLCFSVDLHGDDDGAGVDLVGFFLVSELSFSLQAAHRHKGEIHQADELVASAGKDLPVILHIFMIGVHQTLSVVAVQEPHVRELRGERGVTAVVGPVSVQHPDLCHRRVALLLAAEIAADKEEIVVGHGQVQGIIESPEFFFRHGAEALEDHNVLGNRILCRESLRFLLRGFPGIHGIDAEGFDSSDLFLCRCAAQHIGRCGADHRSGIFVDQFHALYCGICTLVELPRQILHCKNSITLSGRESLLIEIVQRRLREDRTAGLFIGPVRHVFDIVTDQDTHALDAPDAEVIDDILFQLPRPDGKIRFFLDIDSSDTHVYCSFQKFR